MNEQGISKKKYWGSVIFLLVLIGLTFYFVLKDNNLEQLGAVVRQANPVFIALGILAMFGFIGCEALCVYSIMKSLGQKLSFRRCYKYSCIAFYYSSVTPSASGGQPMQLYYMKKDKINLSLSSLALLIIVFVFQIVELSFGFVTYLLRPAFVTAHIKGIEIFLIYGVAFNLILLTFILIAVFSKSLAHKLLLWGVQLLHKMHIIKNAEKALSSVNEQITEYQEGAVQIRKNPAILVKVFLYTVLQLLCKNVVPYFVYCAFGLNEYGFIDILAMQSILSLAVGSLPLPGAVGASEGGFMMLFKIFFASGMLLPAMLLTRGISFYSMLLISGAVSIIAHVRMKRRDQLEQTRCQMQRAE